MHELFTIVLSKRDLSLAGDLFSVSDSEIVNDISIALVDIGKIISQPDYLENKNDQSVVEICVTRILSCIRETKTADRYCSALVDLLNTCLLWPLQPHGPTKEDPPHAKIAADIISSIFLNYDKKELMKISLPVAVQFLPKNNKELSRNLASYLSLAASDYAYLLSPHVDSIMDSILAGNYGLCRVLTQIYEVSPSQVLPHAPNLIGLLPQCELQEKLAILQLCILISQKTPTVLERCIPELCGFLLNPETAMATMQILLKIAESSPKLIVEHFHEIKLTAKNHLFTISLAAQVLATAGCNNKETAQYALDFVLEHLPHSDRSSQTILLHEATKLCSTFPILFSDKLLACVRQRNITSQQKLGVSTDLSVGGNKTSGGVTIVNLNSTPITLSSHASTTTATINTDITKGRHIVSSTVLSKKCRSSPSSPKDVGKLIAAQNNIKISTVIAPVNLPKQKHSIIATQIAVSSVLPTPPHSGYSRRAKLGDSRSTGRLHPSSNTHRSMTRLNVTGGSVGGLHMSMTRLSSSQHINQIGSSSNNGAPHSAVSSQSSANLPVEMGISHQKQFNSSATNNQTYVTPVPPLSNNVVITGHSKWGIPSTQVTSGGVTVTTSPNKCRPHSHGPNNLLSSSGGLLKYSTDALDQSIGSISIPQNSVSVHHVSPALPALNENQKSVTRLPLNGSHNHEVIVSGPTTNVTQRRNENTSRTLLNANNSILDQRMSTFEPHQYMRDPVQQFCEKHFPSIKSYMDEVSIFLPPPTRCSIEDM